MQRLAPWVYAVALGAIVSCGRGATEPGGSTIGPIGPFPSGVTGKIAFTTEAEVTTSTRAYIRSDVHVIDVANPADRVIYTQNDVFFYGVSWAPDGEHLAVAINPEDGRPHLYLMSATSPGTPVSIYAGPFGESNPSYGPNGQLAYLGVGPDTIPGIFINGQRVLAGTTTDANVGLSWSPSGDTLVFSQFVSLDRLSLSDTTVSLLVASQNGETLTQPAVSPDGSRIAFVRSGGDLGEEGIWTTSPSGGSQQQLTAGSSVSVPQWTPDGSYLALMRSFGASAGIYLVRPGGGTPVRIVGTGSANVLSMAWSR